MDEKAIRLLTQAKQQGYLVLVNGKPQAVYSQYLRFCTENLRPLIQVSIHGKSAHLDINADPVWIGSARLPFTIVTPVHFGLTAELKARCRTIADRGLTKVLPSNKGRACVHSADDEVHMARYIDPDVAISMAKDMYLVWLDAKKHVLAYPPKTHGETQPGLALSYMN